MLLLQFFMAAVAALIESESDISQSSSLFTQFAVNKTRTATRNARGKFIFSENHIPSVFSKAGISFFAKYITVNHNFNKILESDWLPTAVAFLALFGQFLSSKCLVLLGSWNSMGSSHVKMFESLSHFVKVTISPSSRGLLFLICKAR